MDIVVSIVALFLLPLTYPGSSNQRIYWLYLVSAAIIGIVIFLAASSKRRSFSVSELFAFLLPKEVFVHRSAIVDYKYFFVDAIALTVFLGPLLFGAEFISEVIVKESARIFQHSTIVESATITHNFLYTFFLLIAADVAFFLAHYMLHNNSILWEFHKVHHSAEVLTPMTAYRVHPVESAFTGTIAAICVGSVDGIMRSFYCDSATLVTLFSQNVFLFIFYFFGFNLRHSHIWFAYPAAVSKFFISPAQHQVHHSLDPQHYNKNLGYIFAVWDRLADTLYVPNGREDLKYGLAFDEHLEFRTVFQLYVRPFKVIWRNMGRDSRIQG